MKPYSILMMGASYGSLLASKILLAGHDVSFVCLPNEAELINSEGFRVRIPIAGRSEPIEIDSRVMRGRVSASGAAGVRPAEYDLIGLAMAEPQYRLPEVRELLGAVAESHVPCVSIMNMPPLPYLRRIPGLDYEALRTAYTDSTVWDNFDPAMVTLCSPDAQAVRPPGEKSNLLQVTLPTNFKVAQFAQSRYTAILRQLQDDIQAVRFDAPYGKIEVPVKFRLHESLFVPLAKWPMLLTGNYRCVTEQGARPISTTVHSDIERSRSVYNFVLNLCVELGASLTDLVPFEKYAAAANVLSRPSSVARALSSGASVVERADKLVQILARQRGLHHPEIDRTVALVDELLDLNERKVH